MQLCKTKAKASAHMGHNGEEPFDSECLLYTHHFRHAQEIEGVSSTQCQSPFRPKSSYCTRVVNQRKMNNPEKFQACVASSFRIIGV